MLPRFPQNAFVLKSDLLVTANGSFVEVEDYQIYPVQMQLVEGDGKCCPNELLA